MTVTLHHGDCLDVLRGMGEASVDSVVTDPPYGFGFMGKHWDRGQPTFRIWDELLRVLKPGAHLVAFGGCRTYHRMVCAIEDAGFEIRDQLAWLYGSGFPKSHDIGKAIDKRGGAEIGWFGPWLREERKRRGIGQRDLCERCGFHGFVNHGGAVANWELGLNLPTVEQFNVLCRVLDLPFARLEEAKREVLGMRPTRPGLAFTSLGPSELPVTIPATPEAARWAGWGTALKPAHEPIVLARKPLACPTVAAQVLQNGCGAINVDGCRVPGDVPDTTRGNSFGRMNDDGWQESVTDFKAHAAGRWPANLVHDGSPEVLEAFAKFGERAVGNPNKIGGGSGGIWAEGTGKPAGPAYADTGTAARFFPALGFGEDELRFMYSAKAGKADRAGSKHPTIKPVALMRWLCRLITPPGGVVLDPFGGSGTTAEAALREGFSAVLIEREAEYVADIHARLARYRDEAPLLAEVAA